MTQELAVRIRARSVVSSVGCWLFTPITSTGYGAIKVEGRNCGVHRVMFAAVNGAIPDGLWVLHKCDVRNCVNPNHLFLGTPSDNTRDALNKGRLRPPDSAGEKHWKARLKSSDVLAIRASVGVTQAALGRRYGVTSAAIRRILTRKAWMHI